MIYLISQKTGKKTVNLDQLKLQPECSGPSYSQNAVAQVSGQPDRKALRSQVYDKNKITFLSGRDLFHQKERGLGENLSQKEEYFSKKHGKTSQKKAIRENDVHRKKSKVIALHGKCAPKIRKKIW